METRHPVRGPFSREFLAFVIIAELQYCTWRIQALLIEGAMYPVSYYPFLFRDFHNFYHLTVVCVYIMVVNMAVH